MLDHLELLTTATLLLHDAGTDNDEIASAIAIRYVRLTMMSNDRCRYPSSDWRAESALDKKIFLGVDFNTKLEPAKL